MIREFAVEPEVMATWQHFRELFHQFGVSQGRLISEFPSKWRKTLYELVADREKKGLIDPAKAKSICDRIAAARDRFCSAGGRAFDPSPDMTWLKNAWAHQTRQPFAGIIVRPESCPAPANGVLVAGDFDPDSAPWKAERQAKVPRTTVALTECARLLLLNSKELVLVEPNFNATEPRFMNSVIEFVAGAGRGKPWQRCELHTRAAENSSDQTTRTYNCRRSLEQSLPSNVSVTVHFWHRLPGGEKLHARYLLTELGGLQFDYGLDIGEPGETTVVTLLDHSHWAEVREDYRSGSKTFVPAQGSPIQVVG